MPTYKQLSSGEGQYSLWGCMVLSTPLRLGGHPLNWGPSILQNSHALPAHTTVFLPGSQRLKIPAYYCTTQELLESLVIGMIWNEMATVSQLLTTNYQIKCVQGRASTAADSSHSFSFLPLGSRASSKW